MTDEQAQLLKVVGLTYVSDAEPGISRLRRGKGFAYRHPDGTLVTDDEVRERIRGLGLPPPTKRLDLPDGQRPPAGDRLRCARAQAISLSNGLEGCARATSSVSSPISPGRCRASAGGWIAISPQALTMRSRSRRARGASGCGASQGRQSQLHPRQRHIRRDDTAQAPYRSAPMESSCVSWPRAEKRVRRSLRHPRCSAFSRKSPTCRAGAVCWRDTDGSSHSVDSGQLNAYLADDCRRRGHRQDVSHLGRHAGGVQHTAVDYISAGRDRASSCSARRRPRHCTTRGRLPLQLCPSRVLDLALEDSPAGIESIARPPAERLRGLRTDENRLLSYLSAPQRKRPPLRAAFSIGLQGRLRTRSGFRRTPRGRPR